MKTQLITALVILSLGTAQVAFANCKQFKKGGPFVCGEDFSNGNNGKLNGSGDYKLVRKNAQGQISATHFTNGQYKSRNPGKK